jgi:hypothetical protein
MPSMYGQPSFDDILNEYSAQAPAGGMIAPPSPNNISSPWKSFMSYINGPMGGTTAGDDDSLLAYKPVSRSQMVGQTLLGAAQGVMNARGPYRNPLGQGLVGAGMGYQQAQQEDTQRRQQAVQDQYRKMGASLQMANAQAALAKARASGQHVVGEGQRVVDQEGNIIAAGAPKTGEANGTVYQTDPATGRVTPMARFPGQPTTIEGLAVSGLTGGSQPQVYGGGAGAAPGPGGVGGGLDPAMASKILNAWIVDKTKPTQTQVTMSPQYHQAQGESEYAKTRGRLSGERLNDYLKEGDAAAGALSNVQVMKQLQGVTDTGPGTEQLMPLRKALVASGLASDEQAASLGKQQLYQALGSRNVTSMLGGKLGAGISNADVGFATKMTANLGNMPEANDAILDVQEKLANRNQEVAQLAAKWDRENAAKGGIFGTDRRGQSWDEYLKDWRDAHPLFDEEYKKKFSFTGGKAGGGGGGDPYAGYQ